MFCLSNFRFGRGGRGGRGRSGRGRGGRGRGRGKGPMPTAEELDAELDAYNKQVSVVIVLHVCWLGVLTIVPHACPITRVHKLTLSGKLFFWEHSCCSHVP